MQWLIFVLLSLGMLSLDMLIPVCYQLTHDTCMLPLDIYMLSLDTYHA